MTWRLLGQTTPKAVETSEFEVQGSSVSGLAEPGKSGVFTGG